MTTIDQDFYSEGVVLDEPNSEEQYVKRAGPFVLGPKLGNSPVKCISHCLARKEGTNNYYTVKILTKRPSPDSETIDDQQGKVLIHTEYSLLSALRGEPGVIQQHGLFKDISMEEVEAKNGDLLRTGRMQTKLCLVLDCYTPHDFCPEYTQLTNLQYYVIKEKRLSEFEAIDIFFKTVQIVERLHKRNIVHRDLKLGNLILNKETREVKITNFCLGKQLASESDYLKDQRGSPAYISPDVISGKPYLGKPSDMWALGVVLYTMLCGQFPFYDKSPTELFKKIKSAEFHIPIEHNISQSTVELIQSLLVLNPAERLTASQALIRLRRIMSNVQAMRPIEFTQVVPDCVGPSRRRTYDKIEATPFHLPSPMCSEPAKVVEETEEVDSDYGSLPSQELEYEEQGSDEEPPKKMRTNDFLKHLTSMLGESQVRFLIEQWQAARQSSGALKWKQQQSPSSPAARQGFCAATTKKRRNLMSSTARVPSPSTVMEYDGVEMVEEERSAGGVKEAYAPAPPLHFAHAN